MIMHHQFIRIAKRFGPKIAINDRSLDRKVTYRRALTASWMLSKQFAAYDPGFIGIMLPNSAGSILSIFGTLMSGRVPVLINYATGAADNCEYAQKKCAFDTIITSRALCEKISCRHVDGMVYIEDIMAGITLLDKLAAMAATSRSADRVIASLPPSKPDDTLLILFTSGSEKEPKAVQLTHRNLDHNLAALTIAGSFTDDDIILAVLPYFHVFGLTSGLWIPLCTGMTTITYANPLEFKTVCKIVRAERVTFLAGTPTFFWGYLKNAQPGTFDSVRILLSGGDRCPDQLREEYLKQHNKILFEAYGTTETSPGISVNSPNSYCLGSVGRPLDGVEVRVEHVETGVTCGIGEVGKILVRGANVMKGYFDDLEQTALSIRQGWYDTGDMGYLDAEGFLWHVGRLRRFLKVGGEMISLVKVEHALEKIFPPDVECCVVEVPDALRGARIVAAVSRSVDEKSILKRLSEYLPSIAHPSRFIVTPEMPRMASGKIDFRKLTETVRDMIHTHGSMEKPAARR
jgi:acyl-[acyl-carrier-protein]-phospholipid O-acyltransferase / long-chain-fatty-acid--[acyl-carrier-protein] ligase